MAEEIPQGMSASFIPERKFSFQNVLALAIICMGPAWMISCAVMGASAIYHGRWERAIDCWSVLAVPLVKR